MLKQLFVTTVVVLLSLSLVQSDGKDEKANVGDPADRDNMGDMDIMGALSDCNETFRISMEYLLALNESGSFPDETDKTPKCYIRCVLETVGAATEDGQFDPDRTEMALMGIRGVRELDKVREVAMSCAATRQESCKCERSYQFIKCLMEMEVMMPDNKVPL